jgi:hypothetical protein
MNQSYNVRHLSAEAKKDLCRRAKAVSYEWWADKLDCGQSLHRRPIEVEFEEYLHHLDELKTIFTVIWRMTKVPSYLEVGFRAMGEVDYFLWIHVEPQHIPGLVQGFSVHAYN